MVCRMFSYALFVALACCANSIAVARTWHDGIAAEISAGTQTLPYRYYLPDNYDPTASYPLVLFLHGSGERGTNNLSQILTHIAGLIDQTHQNYPSILVAPQAPPGSNWSSTSTRELTEDVLQRMIADFGVDTDRLYLTGLSMGGFGTLDYLNYYTNIEPGLLKFAAGVPMSSGIGNLLDLSQVEPWKDTPIWLMHGDLDPTVSVALSRNAFRSFTGLGAVDPIDFNATALGQPTAITDNIRYTEVVGGGHGIWSPIYGSDELYDWMFAQSLAIPEPGCLVLALLGFISIGYSASRSGRD